MAELSFISVVKRRAAHVTRCAVSVLYAVFFTWFCWAQAGQPQPTLWWMVMLLGAVVLTAAYLKPRSIYYWLPASIMGANLWLFWLPWPHAQFSCVGPALIVCTAIFLAPRTKEYATTMRTPFVFAGLCGCLAISAALGILSRFVLTEAAAWNEFWLRIRIVPLLGDFDRYTGLRYLWMWALALAFHLTLYRIMRAARAVWLLLWSIQWTAAAMAALLICQYAAQHGIVGSPDLAGRVSAMAGGPLVLANILMVCWVLGAYMAHLQTTGTLRAVCAVCMVLQFTGVVLCGSMANTAVVLVLCVVWWWSWLKKMRALPLSSLAVRCLVLALGVSVTATVLWTVIPKDTRVWVRTLPALRLFVHDPLHLWSDDVRVLLPHSIYYWYAAAKMAYASPLWGVGCGRFAQEYALYAHTTPSFPLQVHNMYLRVCAEGGLITAGLLALVLATVTRRIRWFLAIPEESTTKACAVMIRSFAVALATVAIASLMTDVWYDTPRCVMFLALLAACVRCFCDQPGTVYDTKDETTGPQKRPSKLGDRVTRLYTKTVVLTWGHAPRIPLRWVAGCVLLGSLATVGFFNSRNQCDRIMHEDSLMFGWYEPLQTDTNWGGIGHQATLYMTIAHPIFSFSVKALNAAMTGDGNTLSLFINNGFTATIPLNTTKETRCYFDVSGLVSESVALRFETARICVPAHTGIFPDARPYGALLTPVVWIDESPTSLVRTVVGVWNNQWTAYAATYNAMGFPLSNRTFAVDTKRH